MPAPKEVAAVPVSEPEGTDEPAQLVARIEGELELLARNVEILEKLSKSPPIGIIRLSEAMHLPIHKTRYSLHLLEREGVVQPSADGAVVTDRAAEFWAVMNRSLDRMENLIRQLRARAVEHAERPPPGRKGY
jgi:eukaryotic-like serine/threonine-protein kinase